MWLPDLISQVHEVKGLADSYSKIWHAGQVFYGKLWHCATEWLVCKKPVKWTVTSMESGWLAYTPLNPCHDLSWLGLACSPRYVNALWGLTTRCFVHKVFYKSYWNLRSDWCACWICTSRKRYHAGRYIHIHHYQAHANPHCIAEIEPHCTANWSAQQKNCTAYAQHQLRIIVIKDSIIQEIGSFEGIGYHRKCWQWRLFRSRSYRSYCAPAVWMKPKLTTVRQCKARISQEATM